MKNIEIDSDFTVNYLRPDDESVGGITVGKVYKCTDAYTFLGDDWIDFMDDSNDVNAVLAEQCSLVE